MRNQSRKLLPHSPNGSIRIADLRLYWPNGQVQASCSKYATIGKVSRRMGATGLMSPPRKGFKLSLFQVDNINMDFIGTKTICHACAEISTLYTERNSAVFAIHLGRLRFDF